MDDNFDPLADLGLDNVGNSAPSDENESDAPVKQKRERVKIASITVSEDEELAPLVRVGGGGRESQYKFDELTPPKPHPTKEGSFLYSAFTVEPAEGEDEGKLTRSVQSATTAQNTKEKEAGTQVYFETRTIRNPDGSFLGVRVYRTDARPAK